MIVAFLRRRCESLLRGEHPKPTQPRWRGQQAGVRLEPAGAPIARDESDMEERPDHLTVVIGASSVAEDLRRSLVQHGVTHAGVTAHLRGLRRTMVLQESEELVVVCVSLDPATLERHGPALRQLLADHHCSPRGIRSVGLLTGLGFTRDVAEMGCDVYVEDSAQAAKAVRMLARRWRDNRRRQAAEKPAARPRATSESLRTDVWMWGKDALPIELEPLLMSRPIKRRSTQAKPEDDAGSAHGRSTPSK